MMYYNWPCNPTEIWVFGKKTFLFHAKIGDIKLNNGSDAWNPTDFERAVKQKCQKIRKNTGIKYCFEFCDHYAMNRYMSNGESNFYTNFPFEHFAELRR